MFTRTHLTNKQLAEFCHRLAISAESGIDARRTWRREADAASGSVKRSFRLVSDGIEGGDSISTSLTVAGPLFPRLFIEMVEVGELSGTLPAVLHRLSDHYRRQFDMARDFRRQLTWPVIQLLLAVFVIGVLIAVLGSLGAMRLNGEPIDLLGLGVTGSAALVLYIEILVVIGLAVALLVTLVRRRLVGTRLLQHLVMKLPSVGQAIEKLCLARLAWALHLMLNVEMDLRRLIPLALKATGSDYYTSHGKAITSAVEAGRPMHQAFAETGIFPSHFLDSLYVAEESGQIVESMSRLSRQYEAEADDAIRTLSTIFSFLVWGLIMIVIGAMVLRLFKVLYLDALSDALNF